MYKRAHLSSPTYFPSGQLDKMMRIELPLNTIHRRKVIIDRLKSLMKKNLLLNTKTRQPIISAYKFTNHKKEKKSCLEVLLRSFYYSNNRLKIQIVVKRDLIFLVLYVFKFNKK
jgi:hypothetical protein